MLSKNRLLGVPLSLAAWVTMTGFVYAQSAPPRFVTMEVTCCGAAGSTRIEIVGWNGARPSTLRITIPDDPVPQDHVFDEFLYSATTWQQTYTDPEGWTHGHVAAPNAGGQKNLYEVRYRENGSTGDQLQMEYWPVGDPTSRANVVANYAAGTHPQAASAIIIIIIIAIIIGCAWAHAIAIATCNKTASDACGGDDNVKSVDFAGICGSGSCHIECK